MMWEIKCGIHTLGNPFESHEDAVKKCLELNSILFHIYPGLYPRPEVQKAPDTLDQGPLFVVESG